MDPRRHAEELASRCVALVIYYQHARNYRPIHEETVAEIRAIAVEARRDRLSWTGISAEVLSELKARYDSKSALQLHAEFIAAFDDDLQPTVMRV